MLRAEVFSSLRVEDVTDDPVGRDVACSLVARCYARLATREPGIEEVLADLCQDPHRATSRTLLATGLSPDTQRIEPLGTIRIGMAACPCPEGQAHPLEFMDLVSPPQGWARFSFQRFDPARSAEIGRFALSPLCRSGRAADLRLNVEVTRCLFARIRVLAAGLRRDQIWGLMPPSLMRLIGRAGVTGLPAPPLALALDRHATLFRKYDRYWLLGKPQLYRLILDGVGSPPPSAGANDSSTFACPLPRLENCGNHDGQP